MRVHCPACNRILYNRRLKNCGFCGALLPEHLRFTPEETGRLERIEKDLEKSAADRRKKADEEERARQQADGGSIDIGGIL